MVALGSYRASFGLVSGHRATESSRTSAEIAQFTGKRLPVMKGDPRKVAADLIWAAFPAASAHQVCLSASQYLGCSPDTIERILSKGTAKADWQIIVGALARYQERTGKSFPLGNGLELAIVARAAE